MCSPPGGCSALWALGPYRRTGPDAGLYSALNICPRPRRAPSPNIEDFSYPPAARLLLYSRRPAGRGQCFFFPPGGTAGVLTKGLIPLRRQPHHLTPAAGRLRAAAHTTQGGAPPARPGPLRRGRRADARLLPHRRDGLAAGRLG